MFTNQMFKKDMLTTNTRAFKFDARKMNHIHVFVSNDISNDISSLNTNVDHEKGRRLILENWKE